MVSNAPANMAEENITKKNELFKNKLILNTSIKYIQWVTEINVQVNVNL